jgi:hypothetical protein
MAQLVVGQTKRRGRPALIVAVAAKHTDKNRLFMGVRRGAQVRDLIERDGGTRRD